MKYVYADAIGRGKPLEKLGVYPVLAGSPERYNEHVQDGGADEASEIQRSQADGCRQDRRR